MEFMNHGGRPGGQPVSTPTSTTSTSVGGSHNNKKGIRGMGAVRFVTTILFAGVLALIVGVALYIGLVKPNTESSRVDSDKMQAVFLNGGQVYFGHIKDLNNSYLRVKDIYYLRVNQQVQPNQSNNNASSNDISLVKLGCELHGPTDEMLINREQVIFWENLKTDGQVAKAVAEYQKQNPNGQDCNTAQTQSTTDTKSTETKQPDTKQTNTKQ